MSDRAPDHPERDTPVLLDTHAWVWLLEGREGLAVDALELAEGAAEDSRLWVSAISLWEISMLEARGRLRFDTDCLGWIDSALGAPGTGLMPLTPTICMRSANLPGEFHGDPADRIIVATARELGATLVTRDRSILGYAAAGHLRAMEV